MVSAAGFLQGDSGHSGEGTPSGVLEPQAVAGLPGDADRVGLGSQATPTSGPVPRLGRHLFQFGARKSLSRLSRIAEEASWAPHPPGRQANRELGRGRVSRTRPALRGRAAPPPGRRRGRVRGRVQGGECGGAGPLPQRPCYSHSPSPTPHWRLPSSLSQLLCARPLLPLPRLPRPLPLVSYHHLCFVCFRPPPPPPALPLLVNLAASCQQPDCLTKIERLTFSPTRGCTSLAQEIFAMRTNRTLTLHCPGYSEIQVSGCIALWLFHTSDLTLGGRGEVGVLCRAEVLVICIQVLSSEEQMNRVVS